MRMRQLTSPPGRDSVFPTPGEWLMDIPVLRGVNVAKTESSVCMGTADNRKRTQCGTKQEKSGERCTHT